MRSKSRFTTLVLLETRESYLQIRVQSQDTAARRLIKPASIRIWLRANESTRLDIVIQVELVWMRAQPDRIDLFLALVVEPGLDHVAGEHIAAQQESVIALERVKRLIQRPGCRLHVLCLGGRQVIKVLVDWPAWVDLVVDAVKAGHQHRGER